MDLAAIKALDAQSQLDRASRDCRTRTRPSVRITDLERWVAALQQAVAGLARRRE